MRVTRPLLLAAVVCFGLMARGSAHDLAPAPVAAELRVDFAERLEDPVAYGAAVDATALHFPEGNVFPFVFPAMAWTNLAAADPALRPEARDEVAVLLEALVPRVEKLVGRELEDLRTTRGFGTYVGQVGVVLGAYRLLGGDGRFDAAHRGVVRAIRADLDARAGRPLDSYPGQVWPFDTVPALLTLKLWDAHSGEDDAARIEASLAWMDAHVDAQGLPVSQVDARFEAREVARGCDLSYRVALLGYLDRDRARALYGRYAKAYWRERGVLAGFAEWPAGHDGRQDADSGPILMGIGLGATGLGLAATRAAEDTARWSRLRGQLDTTRPLIAAVVAAGGEPMLPGSEGTHTGFLFGDAALFWAVTWHDWDVLMS